MCEVSVNGRQLKVVLEFEESGFVLDVNEHRWNVMLQESCECGENHRVQSERL